MTSRNRMQSVLWTGSVVVATALSLVLMLQVKAVGSEIAETEKAIVSTKQQIAALETEFQTRSRQQQLVRWNEVDFGYVAPRADQFLDGRAQLASLGKQVEIIDAQPVRMAVADAQAQASVAGPAEAAAPVRLAKADAAAPSIQGPALKGPAQKGPALKGEAEKPAIRLAEVETKTPAMMRQLVATDTRIRPSQLGPKAAAKVSAAKPAAAPKLAAGPNGFAERFDLDTVIAEGKR